MSFKTVFRSLQEVFPQVDLRILKAVAIEHSKDVDAAVEFVLSEVLPSFNEPTESPYTLDDNTHLMRKLPAKGWVQTFCGNQKIEKENKDLIPESSAACESDPYINHSPASLPSSTCSKKTDLEEDEPNVLLHSQAGEEVLSNLLSEPTFGERGKAAVADHTTGAFHVKSDLCNDIVIASSSNMYISDQLISNEELVVVTSNTHVNNQIFNENFEEQATSVDAVENISQPLETFQSNSYGDLPANVVQGANMNASAFCTPVQNFLFSEKEAPASFSEDSSNLECGDQSSLSSFEGQYLRVIQEKSSESVVFEAYMPTVAEIPTLAGSQSGSAVGMNILEDLISDVKSNKETLISSFVSVKNMIKDVELHEDRAKQAKEEASKAGVEMLIKAKDMKEMLRHAKEAKEMQAGEVYGEKFTLASEARELQSRLLNLRDEKEKSLSIIEEIHQTLEACLAIAKKEQSAAEQEKFEKEEAARKILKEQEVIMEELVQDSKRLQQDSEENAKLRYFLMDRGRTIDVLQGEIALICEDVKLLKGRVDGHVPPSKSLLLTSSSLASPSSSSSNVRSLSERILHTMELGRSPKGIPEDPTRNNQLESNVGDSSNRATSDDDWELFE